jgi:hypothetical protein
MTAAPLAMTLMKTMTPANRRMMAMIPRPMRRFSPAITQWYSTPAGIGAGLAGRSAGVAGLFPDPRRCSKEMEDMAIHSL